MSLSLTPQRAIEMQKAGMGYAEIARALGLHVNTVAALVRNMQYDPARQHIDTIAQMVTDGVGLHAAMAACGINRNGYDAQRVRAMLRARGVEWIHEAQPREARPKQEEPPRCVCCTILLEPYDATDAEQQSWQCGTRDGVHCTACEDRIDNGGGWVGRMPLATMDVADGMREALADGR